MTDQPSKPARMTPQEIEEAKKFGWHNEHNTLRLLATIDVVTIERNEMRDMVLALRNHETALNERIVGLTDEYESLRRELINTVLSDAVLEHFGAAVHFDPVVNMWVSRFLDFNCVTQGRSRVDAILMLLDAARLMLRHLQPESACDTSEFLKHEP